MLKKETSIYYTIFEFVEVIKMKVRIVEKGAFRIVGLKERVGIVFQGANHEIEAMWQQMNEELLKELLSISNIEPSGIINASANFSEGRMEEKGELDHYIGVATTKEGPDNLSQLEVPASSWAVFDTTGLFPDVVQDMWGRIYSEWLPSSDYQVSEGPEILWIGDKDLTIPMVKSEIWIPVSKKQD